MIRRLTAGLFSVVTILVVSSGWSQEEQETAAALHHSIQVLTEMQKEILEELAQLKASSRAVSQEERHAMRMIEEDNTMTLNRIVTELANIERRYREALKNALATPAARD